MIPYVAICLKDLTFINENENFKNQIIINYEKATMIAQTLSLIERCQKTEFTHLTLDMALKSYLMFDILLLDEQAQYECSLHCQPSTGSKFIISDNFRLFNHFRLFKRSSDIFGYF